MKSDITNAVLTYVLAVLVVAGAILASRAVWLTRDLRSLQRQAVRFNATITQVESVYNDAVVFNQKNPNPELARILQTFRAKLAAH